MWVVVTGLRWGRGRDRYFFLSGTIAGIIAAAMLSHKQIWSAIDALAERHGMTPSGLAKAAGLDPTTFNPSKRMATDGKAGNKLRWPSTESLSKILEATGASLDSFMALARDRSAKLPAPHVPVIGFAEAGNRGFFDDGGFPAGQGWDEVPFAPPADPNAYALQVSGNSMEPVYRAGDIVVVSPAAQVRVGDRVVVKTHGGEVMVKVLTKRSTRRIELSSLNPAYPVRQIELRDVAWIARIVWASQ